MTELSVQYGLLLYGAADDAVDFVAIELYDGYLYLKINMGSVTSKVSSLGIHCYISCN